MEGLSVLTIGDSTIDKFLCVDAQSASLIVNKRTKEKELCFNYGEKIPIEKIMDDFGGSALNTAIGFKRAGFKTYISTIVGDDDKGKEILTLLNKKGVSLNGSAVKGRTNQSFVIPFDNERTILSYHEKRDYSLLRLVKTDWIYFASAAMGSQVLIDQLIKASESGTGVVFNPGSWELERFDLFQKLLSFVEYFIVNKDEAEIITGKNSIAEQFRVISEMGAANIAITDGKNGAYIYSESETFHMNIFASEVIDPTGAGDAFSCGFVSGIMRKKDLAEATRWGMVNSSSVVSKFGATDGLLSSEQIEQILSKTNSLKKSKI